MESCLSNANRVDAWLLERLACPRDGAPLRQSDGGLCCSSGHAFPVHQGVPILLLAEAEQTLWVANESLTRTANAQGTEDPWFLDTLGISNEERDRLRAEVADRQAVDPVVRFMIGATNGYLYQGLIGTAPSYPIPELRLPEASESFLDLGCNWGRWCIAAARKGYTAVGLDPSLGAVLAAKRVSRQLGLACHFVVGDARFLPFAASSFDNVFSYSVLQHFSKPNARAAVREAARVLRPGGRSLVQMPNAFGVRCLYHQARRRFREPADFDVRYWTPGELAQTFDEAIGPTRLSVDGFFGLGIQKSDLGLLPWSKRCIIHASELLRSLSRVFPALHRVADSLYLESQKR